MWLSVSLDCAWGTPASSGRVDGGTGDGRGRSTVCGFPASEPVVIADSRAGGREDRWASPEYRGINLYIVPSIGLPALCGWALRRCCTDVRSGDACHDGACVETRRTLWEVCIMATISPPSVQPRGQHNGSQAGEVIREPVEAPSRSTTLDWGNSAPLALFAFAVTTFMLSMVNAGAINKGVEPVVFGVALMFGGITQLIAGIIQLRVGNTFAGVLFSGFGAFSMSLFAIVQWFLKMFLPRSRARPGIVPVRLRHLHRRHAGHVAATNAVVVLPWRSSSRCSSCCGHGQLRSPRRHDPWGGYTAWPRRLCLLSRSGGAVRVLLRSSGVADLASRRALTPATTPEKDVKAWRTQSPTCMEAR